MSLAAAKRSHVDAAVTAFLSELGGVFTFKEEQKRHLRIYSLEKIFSLYLSLAGVM